MKSIVVQKEGQLYTKIPDFSDFQTRSVSHKCKTTARSEIIIVISGVKGRLLLKMIHPDVKCSN